MKAAWRRRVVRVLLGLIALALLSFGPQLWITARFSPLDIHATRVGRFVHESYLTWSFLLGIYDRVSN